MRQVRFDLTPHTLDLFPYASRDLRVTGRGGTLRFVREQCERSLEPMRQIAGARRCPRDCLFLVRQQQIELVDERLHLGGIRAGDAGREAIVHGGQASTKAIDRRQDTAHLKQSGNHEGERERGQQHREHRVVEARARGT